jgi:hypothetical protein
MIAPKRDHFEEHNPGEALLERGFANSKLAIQLLFKRERTHDDVAAESACFPRANALKSGGMIFRSVPGILDAPH